MRRRAASGKRKERGSLVADPGSAFLDIGQGGIGLRLIVCRIVEDHDILDKVTARPSLDLAYSEATDTQLPYIAGGLNVALAHTFKIIDPHVKNPKSDEWERSFRIFDLLL
jgi:hypothetical protein